jgi:hypothetical protein
MSAFASDEFYDAAKTVITKTTQMRIDAAYKKDYKTVCNAIGSKAGTDTMVYYLSFELFDSEELTDKMVEEFGYFYVRNFQSMYKQNLPYELHSACVTKDFKKVDQVMADIESILILESVGQ